MRPDDWSDLKQRGDALIAQARRNRERYERITDALRQDGPEWWAMDRELTQEQLEELGKWPRL